MNKICIFLIGVFAYSTSSAQVEADFETLKLAPESFLNGSDGNGGFEDGNVFLPNEYDESYSSWGGWSISTMTDSLTPGFSNQYSAVTGRGYDGSAHYALSNALFPTKLILQNESTGAPLLGMYVTNSTYAYLSMRDGDSFAKRFGGETGNDPDYFLLTVQKYYNDELIDDKVEFYLADYRFEDNSQDYIIKDWTWLDLSSLGNADSLQFSLSSTDNSSFGINTPAYFCVDNISTATEPVGVRDLFSEENNYHFYPNPAKDWIEIEWKKKEPVLMSIINNEGKLLKQFLINEGQNNLRISDLPAGLYALHFQGQRALFFVVE